MSVSALNNTNYYVPTISTKPASANEAANASSASALTQVQQVDENNTKIQATPNSYASNQENTSSDNSSQNNNANNAPVYTGEEVLAAMSQGSQSQSTNTTNNTNAKQNSQSSQSNQNTQNAQNSNTGEKVLTEEEQKQVDELKARDMEVKSHEQAHIAAGGSYVRGAASYDYQTGPDGKKYAVGGEVSIDTSAVEGDPQATINKAQVVIKAAMAPAEPSGQDRAVASQARQMMASARKELMSEKMNTSSDSSSAVSNDNKTQSSNEQKQVENTTQNENNTDTVATQSAGNNTPEATAQVNNVSTQDNSTTDKADSENKAPVVRDTAPKMNTQSLKSDSVNIPQVNVAGSGLYQAFSNAGMSPIKNANALMQVAGSLISMMA